MKAVIVASALSLLTALPLVSQEMSNQAEPTPAQLEFFEKEIRPVLDEHCYKCHSKDGDKIKGGLLLDTRLAAQSGGDSGPAVVPFDLNESLLYVAVTYDDSSLEMPPKYQLENKEIAAFKKWIEMGAPDPRKAKKDPDVPQHYTNTIDIEEGRKHWAYQVPAKPAPPAESSDPNWIQNPIDAFIQDGHRENELTPAPDADPRSLLRRLYFDLTGLPPQTSQVEEFVEAYEGNPERAIAFVVDHLLDTPQFGERWGRHWLDVARYAESSGKEVNATFPNAWRYRDYVIDSFNEDKPFDQFITEQLAGDLIETSNDLEAAEYTIATGFLAIGTKGLNDVNARQFRFDLVDEQIDTTTQAFLGTTVACARCHDHKFDPIPMTDYYAMAGIFLSSDTLYGTSRSLQNRKSTDLIQLPTSVPSSSKPKSLADMIDLEFQLASLNERRDELLAESAQLRRSGEAEEATRIRNQTLGINNRAGLIEGTLASYDDGGNPFSLAMGMSDREEPFDSQILIRGEEDNPTDERVERGFVQVIKTDDEESISGSESGRLQMARWITSPENPLTARVFANRVWSWLFGEGLVTSVDNFGTTGALPSHPELLDYLAVRLVENDWSVKQLILDITTSRTYRMSSEFRDDYFELDPENRYLWRANKRRLDAESIRDASLAVSGKLDLTRPFASPVAEIGDGFIGRQIAENELSRNSNNRSVYLPIVRGLVPESLGLFDFSDPSLISGKREITTVPSQALYMMNSEFVLTIAESMVTDLYTNQQLRGPELGIEAFYRCYSRPPTEGEGKETMKFIQTFIEATKGSGMSTDQARLLALTTFCQSLIASAEFRYLN